MGECESCIHKAVSHSPRCPQTSSPHQGPQFTRRLEVNGLSAGGMWGRCGLVSPHWRLLEPVPPAQAVESRAVGLCPCVLCLSVHLRAQRGHLLGYSQYPTSAQLLQGDSQWTWALSTLQPRGTLQPPQQLPGQTPWLLHCLLPFSPPTAFRDTVLSSLLLPSTSGS